MTILLRTAIVIAVLAVLCPPAWASWGEAHTTSIYNGQDCDRLIPDSAPNVHYERAQCLLAILDPKQGSYTYFWREPTFMEWLPTWAIWLAILDGFVVLGTGWAVLMRRGLTDGQRWGWVLLAVLTGPVGLVVFLIVGPGAPANAVPVMGTAMRRAQEAEGKVPSSGPERQWVKGD